MTLDSPSPDTPALPATHQAFGVTWHFPFPFPLFRPAPPGERADVVVEEGELPPPPAASHPAGPLRLASPDGVRFGLPGVAKLWVSHGSRVRVERHPNGSDDALRLLLVGPGASLVLHQRGFLPLHGSAVATPRGAVVFLGHSAAGKSTTLGAFLKRGYPMVCDDLAALRLDPAGAPLLHPGVPLYKLWADSAAALGVETHGLPRARRDLEKFLVPAAEQLVDGALPVYAVYQLSRHQDAAVRLEPQSDGNKFQCLLDHTWQKLTVRRMGLHGAHFQRAVAVANAVRVVTARWPEGSLLDADRLADALEADFSA